MREWLSFQCITSRMSSSQQEGANEREINAHLGAGSCLARSPTLIIQKLGLHCLTSCSQTASIHEPVTVFKFILYKIHDCKRTVPQPPEPSDQKLPSGRVAILMRLGSMCQSNCNTEGSTRMGLAMLPVRLCMLVRLPRPR